MRPWAQMVPLISLLLLAKIFKALAVPFTNLRLSIVLVLPYPSLMLAAGNQNHEGRRPVHYIKVPQQCLSWAHHCNDHW